ncbi:hypothetical protein OHT76_25260 [Streptomyces sp. NBC_00287]|uniref:hypothetical protein n=1 Tax=Streptomyces sp. NBC_00287 TaxID=2975702 RepID=UPI002E28C952|nr:hypothetical protein [Streptomyces sp. NBC_00287]
MDALAELWSWYERLRLEPGLTVTWRGPEPDRAKSSASLCAEGAARVAELIAWESGEAQLLLGDVASGEVTDEALQLTDPDALAQVVGRLRKWMFASNV